MDDWADRKAMTIGGVPLEQLKSGSYKGSEGEVMDEDWVKKRAQQAIANAINDRSDVPGHVNGHIEDALKEAEARGFEMGWKRGWERGMEEAAEIVTAEGFHNAYERLALSFSYDTRKASRVPWAEVPHQNKKLMEATVEEVRGAIRAEAEKGKP